MGHEEEFPSVVLLGAWWNLWKPCEGAAQLPNGRKLPNCPTASHCAPHPAAPAALPGLAPTPAWVLAKTLSSVESLSMDRRKVPVVF